jgi:hypothetical protein
MLFCHLNANLAIFHEITAIPYSFLMFLKTKGVYRRQTECLEPPNEWFGAAKRVVWSRQTTQKECINEDFDESTA